MADRNTVKTWFLSLKKPNQAQFHTWMESTWFKGEKIPVADIDGISVYLGNNVPPVIVNLDADGSYIIPPGYAIYLMYITPAVACTINVDTASENIIEDLELDAGKTTAVQLSIVAMVNEELFFTGITGATKIQIHLHKI